MTMRNRRLLLVAGACSLSLLATACAGESGAGGTENGAESWPTEALTIVLPTGPGASVDRLIRGALTCLSDEMGVPVNVDNRPGGGFSVGMRHVLEQPAGGNTAFFFAEPYFAGARVAHDMDVSEWAYVGSINNDRVGLMTNPESFQSIDGVLDALANGEKVTAGVLVGDPAGMGMAELVEELGLPSPTYVSYEDGGELRVDLIGGHLDLIMVNHDGFSDVAESGEGKFVAFFTEERFAETYPDVPTVAEVVEERGGDPAAVPVFPYYRFLATDIDVAEDRPDRFDRWVSALKTCAEDPDFQEWGAENGFTIIWEDGEVVRADSIAFESFAQEHADIFQ
jgi:tripartite-type tricarboxylate transporter receptor subunit TctC